MSMFSLEFQLFSYFKRLDKLHWITKNHHIKSLRIYTLQGKLYIFQDWYILTEIHLKKPTQNLIEVHKDMQTESIMYIKVSFDENNAHDTF